MCLILSPALPAIISQTGVNPCAGIVRGGRMMLHQQQ
jgi:hypothetical protein